MKEVCITVALHYGYTTPSLSVLLSPDITDHESTKVLPYQYFGTSRCQCGRLRRTGSADTNVPPAQLRWRHEDAAVTTAALMAAWRR